MKHKQSLELAEWKNIAKIRAEINEIEIKKTTEKVSEPKSWSLKR